MTLPGNHRELAREFLAKEIDRAFADPRRDTIWISVIDRLPSAGEYTFTYEPSEVADLVCPIGVNKFVALPSDEHPAMWEDYENRVVTPTHWAPLFRGPVL